MPAEDPYRQAAELLWGEAGAWLGDEYTRHNAAYFDGTLPPVPMVIGITAYGGCLALTRAHATPRITVASNMFQNIATVSDTLLHEMVHVALLVRGQDPGHNQPPWCAEITRLSKLLGHDIVARPVRPRRVPNPAAGPTQVRGVPKTVVRRFADPGALTQAQLSRWPHSIRPAGYGDGAPAIAVDSY